MYFLLDYFKKHYLLLIAIILFIIIGIFQIIILSNDKTLEIKSTSTEENLVALNDDKKDEVKSRINVDIKGAIKKPGIYEMKENQTINDVINYAGGLSKNATTLDINLSKIVHNEMVIYISTKNEYNQRRQNKCSKNEINNSKEIVAEDENNKNKAYEIASSDTFVKDYNNVTANEEIISNNPDNKEIKNNSDDNQSSTTLVNINSASKEDLQKIPGIGATKAEKIIEYRINNKFITIEDIKNVSGIGESLYEKIKDYITI